MHEYYEISSTRTAGWISQMLSRLAISGLLVAAIGLQPAPASANWQSDYMAAQCSSGGGIYRDGRCERYNESNTAGSFLGLLLNNLTQDPAGKTATFFGTYEYLCSTKRFGPCTHNREEWERRHGPR